MFLFKITNFAIVVLIGCLPLALQAQDRARQPFVADYFQQQILYNPAFTGDSEQPTLGLSGRIERRNAQEPYGLNAFFQGTLTQYNIGIGLTAQYHDFDDTYTYTTNSYPTNKRLLKVGLASSFQIPMGDFTGLKAGLNIGIIHYKSDEAYIPWSSTQPTVIYNERFLKPNIDIGLLLSIAKLKVGLSFNQLNEPKFQFYSNSPVQQFKRYMVFTAAYKIPVTNWLTIEPTTLQMLSVVNSVGNNGMQPYIDLGVLLRFKQRVFLGSHYKFNDDKAAIYGGMAPPKYLFSFAAGVRLGTTQITLNVIPMKKDLYNTTKTNGRIDLSLLFFRNEEAEEEE
ncbi:MAG: type IX secretion system membrane protein PorP/SprF [Chitinophagales bacterium]|jgi:type IX secretion system PorP/SprF family membrane protein|nr:type IX secretion system membrane protein PorP/SprF [Chitinophagales bacterium]